MSKQYFFKKLIPTALSLTTLGGLWSISEGYRRSVEPSKFEMAAIGLGFKGYKTPQITISSAAHQEALLQLLQIAGYLKPEEIWKALNHLKSVEEPIASYQEIYKILKRSHADQDDPSEFNAKILRKNLAKGEYLSEQNVLDLLLYISQNAFGRQHNQERDELRSQDWMTKYQKEYFDVARKLRLIDREEPTHMAYDASWIAGASRVGVLSRIIDYTNILLKYGINIYGKTFVLAGERELLADLDGINPIILDRLKQAYQKHINIDELNISLPVGSDAARIEEGKKYISYLAQVNNIQLDASIPFIIYSTKESCPLGRLPGRLYPNYPEGAYAKLTESLMAQDLITTYPSSPTRSFTIIDTRSEKYSRPTTASTAYDAAEKFVSHIMNGTFGQKKEFLILFQSNNPYIERQTLSAQREIDKILEKYGLNKEDYKIIVEGVGFGCKQDVPTVHSEFAALMSEKWINASNDLGIIDDTTSYIKALQYQSRDHSLSIPSCPDIHEQNTSLLGYIQDAFDSSLP